MLRTAVGCCVLRRRVHDFGSQIGLRLAIYYPELVAGVIIQNGGVYEDELGPDYASLQEYWDDPSPQHPGHPVGGGQ